MPKRTTRKRTRSKPKTNPEYAQCIVHIPHMLNNRLNTEAELSSKTKAAYVGDLLGRLDDAILLPPDLLARLDRFADKEHLTRSHAARLLVQRSLRELGLWG